MLASSRALVPALLALIGARAVAQALPPTRVAVSAAATVPGGGFEKVGLQTYAYNPVWAGWTFTPQSANAGSGIAKNGSAILYGSNNAPAGLYCAFLEGQGIAATTVTIRRTGRRPHSGSRTPTTSSSATWRPIARARATGSPCTANPSTCPEHSPTTRIR